jgi:hypothetical protein
MRRSGRTRKGHPWLRSALIEAAYAAARRKGTYLAAQYHRLAARRGAKRAAVAAGHSILVSVYYLLRNDVTYHDPDLEYPPLIHGQEPHFRSMPERAFSTPHPLALCTGKELLITPLKSRFAL